MTRPFYQRVHCEHCGRPTTAESPFERWVRGCDRLSSSKGLVRFDLDMLLHRYMVVDDHKGDREVQAMMFVEIKTMGADLSDAQRDSLSMLNQVLRNRRQNIHKSPRQQVGGQPHRVYSHYNNQKVALLMFGGHLLQLANTDPVNSSWMKWDYNWPLTTDQLIELVLFERNPDNPKRKLDIRRRSKPFAKMRTLFNVGP